MQERCNHISKYTNSSLNGRSILLYLITSNTWKKVTFKLTLFYFHYYFVIPEAQFGSHFELYCASSF